MSHGGPNSPNVLGSNVEPLYQVKLLSALHNGDPAVIHPFLAEIGKDRRKSVDGDVDTGAAALHLAVRCGSVQTVALLLAHRAISPNGIHPPGSGTTPLHLAASLGRLDIVNLLLEQEFIDDSLRDIHGKTCREVARGKDVIRAIDDSRHFLNASYRSLLHSYILSPADSPPPPAMIQLLESPRVTFVDLSYLDEDTGTTLLHEAARRKDLRLIELAVRAGADVFVRNRKGKMAYEGGGKDDRVRVFLRQFANHDKTLITSQAPLTEPPTLKGYLNKYTNVAKGYNTRWFVLKNGVLSYYRHQDDESIASRGSIAMKNAVLHLGERTRFEVHSVPHAHSGTQKWYMKANHPVEAHRWTEAIAKSIEWYRQRDAVESDASSLTNSSRSKNKRRSGESDSSYRAPSSLASSFKMHRKSTLPSDDQSRKSMAGSSYADITLVQGTPSMQSIHEGIPPPSADAPTGMETEAGDDGADEDSASSASGSRFPPHDNYELQGNAAAAQLDLTAQLLTNLNLSDDASQRSRDTHMALKASLATTRELLGEYIQMAREREQWWARQLKRERTRQRFWEESLAVVVQEGEALERELRTRSRKRGSRIFAPSAVSTLTSPEKRRPSILGLPGSSSSSFGQLPSSVPEESPGSPPPTATVSTPRASAIPIPPLPVTHIPSGSGLSSTLPDLPERSPLQRQTPARSTTADTLVANIQPSSPESARISPVRRVSGPQNDDDPDEECDTDEEDEFFDAIESNTLPNLLVHDEIVTPASPGGKSPPPSALARSVVRMPSVRVPLGPDIDVAPYEGYNHLRTRLAIGNDQRPSTSLWSVLKHSIGKDLTKISFPVFFNEPTSMLQRMAEDMEFSECLDVAARERDPLRRIAFVAAFAMSNYSSTIGRIAKPFNPMLSETFEYVRPDRQYRYMSEQVSHHPPISACWAESPCWHYFGEVDAQNKFMGKSFEIRPTGVAHAELLLPAEFAPNYPRAQDKKSKGKVVEHYTWKKVTTNVSGFILGSPTIDHYGDMEITNHRTGDQCRLTFKPRGWRGKDAYEISGHVIDSRGGVAFEIAGRWNSQLVAKQADSGGAQLHPDISVADPDSPSVSPEYILLWRNSEKPTGSPFNLTPFAITLNDCPQSTLRPYLSPTDCRLRPDQRAFELGKYELANELKQAQEEKQRAMRRAREEGKMPPHQPRWFSADTDGDTGERVWTPARTQDYSLEYWKERERVWREGGNKSWTGVDDIFIEEPREVSELLAKQ